MKILSWNCWGVGQPRTVQELVHLVQVHRPKVVFLSETRQPCKVVENLKWRLGLRNVIIFKGRGKGGGLAVFWDESVQLDLIKLSHRHINVIIYELPNGTKWRSTFVYGEPCSQMRANMWELLRRIKNMRTEPRCMIGDFNECMWQSEHWSNRHRNKKQMKEFREVLSDFDVFDIGFEGTPWTFDNKHMGAKNVKVRLDRAIASDSWSRIFPEARLRHLVSSRSDHCPILLSLVKDSDNPLTPFSK
ncbi:hypothetical protein BRADI_2g28415v3 [Brachypodium distachyon]|uniref:Endonuclease/exonuclease/phosphatase domain-containing protein n=1 Tax=Brachypodium distachyon TaxID=15368 RepID=A0A2K2DB36_BRADI|nr:hypothetical protein BRADI_2g28415v3 [Brachypodium distachyon]